MVKKCERCGKTFDGYRSAKYCSDCKHDAYADLRRAAKKRWQAAHPEKERERHRRYYRKKIMKHWNRQEATT